jgi:hypothetical protein
MWPRKLRKTCCSEPLNKKHLYSAQPIRLADLGIKMQLSHKASQILIGMAKQGERMRRQND